VVQNFPSSIAAGRYAHDAGSVTKQPQKAENSDIDYTGKSYTESVSAKSARTKEVMGGTESPASSLEEISFGWDLSRWTHEPPRTQMYPPLSLAHQKGCSHPYVGVDAAAELDLPHLGSLSQLQSDTINKVYHCLGIAGVLDKSTPLAHVDFNKNISYYMKNVVRIRYKHVWQTSREIGIRP
jgi:hypothetical protein